MYLKKYIKPYKEQEKEDNQEIEAKIDVICETQGNYKYYFYQITFNNLKENEILRTLKIYYPANATDKIFNVYKQNSIDLTNEEEVIKAIETIATVQADLEELKTTTIEGVTILEVDLTNLGYEINPTNNKIVYTIKTDDNIMNSALMDSIINEETGEKAIQIYAEVVNYQGINKTSKIEVYPVDDKTKVIVNNNDRKMYFTIDLIKTLGKHCPISLSVVGSNDLSFNYVSFYTKMKWSFQNTIEHFNENNIKDIYITDLFNKKERYYLVKDITSSKYKEKIVMHEGDRGEVYYNDNNGNYIYFEEENGIQKFKIYDKYGKYSYYENISGITYLKETSNELGIKTTYLWDGAFLMEVTNSEGSLVLSSDNNDYLTLIKYPNNEVRVNFEFTSFATTKTVAIKTYLNDIEIKTIYLCYEDDLKISKIGESISDNYVCLEYFGTRIQKVYNQKEQLVAVNNLGVTLYEKQYTKLNEYTYTKEERYTKFETNTGEIVKSYYDELGRKRLEIDQDYRMISYDYIGNSEYLSSNSILQTQMENMLMDENFNRSTLINENSNWNINYQNPSSTSVEIDTLYEIVDLETTEFEEFIGNEVLLINGNKNTPVILKQKINKRVKHGDQFLLNMFIKKKNLYSYGNYAYVCFYNNENDYKINRYNIDTNSPNWEVLTKIIVAEDNYEKIYVGVVIKGASAFYLDNVKLTQLASGNRYTYDSRNNIVEILGANNEITKINYDTSNKISYLSLPNNTSYHYFYDEKGRMIKAKDNKGNILTLTYSNNNLVEQTLANKKMAITTRQVYDNLNNPTQYIDEYNISSHTMYDNLNRLRQEVLPSGINYTHTYNSTNDLEEIKAENYLHSYTYEDNKQIKEVVSSNGSKYTFIYDTKGNLLKVKYNDIILNTFTYNESRNGIPLNLISTSKRNVQDPYTFTYDNKQRLTTITLNNQPIARYQYDNRENISESIDCINGSISNYIYDIDNKLIKISTDRNQINYYYDDQNNIQKNVTIDNNGAHSIEYDYDYERNKYTLEHYGQKLINSYNQDVVIGGKEGLGTNGLEPLENTSTNNIYNQTLTFTKKNQYIKYDLSTANKNLKVINKLANGFSYTEWKKMSLIPTSMCLWFKPTGTFSETPLLKFTTKQEQTIIEIKIDENGKLDISPSTILNLIDKATLESVALNEWNLLEINLSNNIEIKLNGNNQNNTTIIGSTLFINQLIEQYLTIGGSSDTTSDNLEMSFDVSLLSVGPYIPSQDIKDIYYEGLKILNNNPGVLSTTKTRYLPINYSYNYEVYTLNGVYESNRNNKLEVKYKKGLLPFEYDETTNGMVYSSYQYKESSLGVYPALGTKGLISIKFKLENKEINNLNQAIQNSFYNQGKRYILSQNDLAVYVENLILKVEKNGTILCSTSVNENEWYTFTLFIGTTSDNLSEVYLNTTLVSQFELSHTFTSLMYIGTNDVEEGKALDGYLKELIMSNIVVLTNNRATIQSNFMKGQIEHIKNYDELGRVIEKRIKYKSNVLSNEYTYDMTRLVKERILGKTINYTYDKSRNINQIIESGVVVKNYTYDTIGRLIRVVEPNGNYNYTYDVDGNIKRVVYTPTTGTPLYNVYTYHNTNKDLLTHMINEIYGKEYTFEYPLDSDGKISSMNPIGISRNGVAMPITYEGKRIIQIGTTNTNLESIYQYDELGRRIKKICPVYDGNGNYLTRETHEYAYDGENLIYEKITPLVVRTPYTIPCELYYKYDENGELIGVEFNNKNYFYIRDALGIIHKIVDENNVVVVDYSYDEWGVVSVDYTTTTNGYIGYINSFIYKGYYYDKDQEMYWLKNRFYDPIVKRFLTIDDIQYLPLDSLGNFNLYSYCYNNPVNYKQRPVSSSGSITIPSISISGSTGNRISASAVKQIAKTLSSSKFSGFNLFGYELRTSAGWNTSPDIATSFFGRIGFSSYVTHTQGQSGMLYVFAGSTSDVMNWFGTTYYAGVGINLFDILGVEAYLETVGIGAQVSIGNFNIGANINLIGGTSITFGWDTDLGNGMTKTDVFTVGVNTGCLVAVIYWIYKFVTTGDPSPVSGLQPAY